MSKKSIKRLNDVHKSYDLTVAATTINEQIVIDGKTIMVNKPAAQVIITVFDHGEKGAIILKKSAAYGVGANFMEAQSNAVDLAIEGLGL